MRGPGAPREGVGGVEVLVAMRAAQVGHDVRHLRADATDGIQDQDGARGQYQYNSICGRAKRESAAE